MYNNKHDLLKMITDLDLIIPQSSDFLLEKKYYGTYADIPEEEEKAILEDLDHHPWRKVVEKRYYERSNWLYKIITDSGRAQFLNLLPIPKEGTYLDIGSGWGQVAIPLAKLGHSIAFDLTKNRLEIVRKIGKQEGVAVSCIQGNFLSFPFKDRLFDLIIFNGSLEWIASARNNDKDIRSLQLKALQKTEKLLNANGRVYIGIENSLGAKYLLGALDDHTSIPHLMYLSEFSAGEKYLKKYGGILPAKTWSLNEYFDLFHEAGLKIEKVYGCFPDYKLIRKMIDIEEMDEHILNNDMFVEEHIGANGELFEFNAEIQGLYRTFALNKISKYICPSYGFILKKRG